MNGIIVAFVAMFFLVLMSFKKLKDKMGPQNYYRYMLVVVKPGQFTYLYTVDVHTGSS